MNDPTAAHHHDDDPRLVAAVQEYVAATEAGRRPKRRDFLARYPEVADELAACLDGLAFVQSAAGTFHDVAAPPIDPETAKPLGDFKLIRQLGRGGMGVVYEAEQVSLGRRVALKVLPLASALDPRQLQRFRNEALAAAQLHHTNVVPVHAVGCERSVHFYAMQLIDGQSLADVIRELQTNPQALDTESATASLASLRSDRRREFHRTVALLGAQAADGLDYAHQRGVVHRDIKPGNLLLDTAGTLWIADFGLAQLQADAAGGEALTRPGDMLGTLRYMSPEQASGRAVLVDQRTDIYALGTTLFELLTLRPAVQGKSQVDLIKSIQEDDPPSAKDVDPSVPREMDLILRKAMAKDVAERYQDAGELAADLRRFLDDQPIKAKAPTLAQKLSRWTRRHRRGVAVAVAMLAFATLGMLVTTILVTQANLRVKQAYLSEQSRAFEAEQSYNQAREAVDLLTRFAAEELAEDPLANDDRRRLLASAMGFYDNFLGKHNNTARDADEIAEARQAISNILAELETWDHLRRVGERAELLTIPEVRDALGVNRSQLSRNQLHDAFRFDLSDMADDSSSQRRTKYENLAAAGERLMHEALTADQHTRLQQITWQIQGARALTDPELAQRLALTETQHEQLGQLLTETQQAWEQHNLAQGGRANSAPRTDRLAHREEALNIHADSLAKVLALLTPEQKRLWEELVGPAYSRDRLETRLGSGLGPVFGSPPEHHRPPPPY